MAGHKELEVMKYMDELGYLLDQYRGLRDLDSKIIALETIDACLIQVFIQKNNP